jgi:hypothetical protein
MNITVLIGSCDKYSYLWDNFDFLFKKYCELNTKKILVSETLVFNNNLPTNEHNKNINNALKYGNYIRTSQTKYKKL